MIAMIKRILAVSGKYKGKIQRAFVTSFLKSMFSKAPIFLAFFALTEFFEGSATANMCLMIGIAMVACLVLQIILQHLTDRLQSGAGFEVFADKRMDLGKHLRKLPMGYFTEGNIGKISSVLSTDMVFIEENCMTELANMMSDIFSQIIMIAFLLFFNLWLSLAAIVVMGVILLVAKGMKKEALEDSAVRQDQSENLTGAVLDFAEGIGIIKTYNLLGDKSRELTDNFRRSRETSLHFEEAHAPWQRKLQICYGLGAASIVAIAMTLQQTGVISIPYLAGIMLFVFDVFGPVKALYASVSRLTVMNSCMDRIEAVFLEKELPDNGSAALSAESDVPEVEFKNVSFGYGEKEVLHNISFTLPRNQMLALVGPSGGGKSTIANLLARFWDVKAGQVLIRGKDVRGLPLSKLMNHISMVFQRVYLFQDTIYNNISMGRPDATKQEVYDAAKKARCYDFIMALPDGFDTMVGEGGESLSGGEKQRISIARCILKDAPIVILDEATASVDADNERYIQEAISELCRGKTLLVIAHRLSTIRSANQILVVSDGAVAEEGTHNELMEIGGIYKKFVTVRENSTGWNRRRSAAKA